MQKNIHIDINADLGEGLPTDEVIMQYISSANIACGYHAGNTSTMMKTVELCLKYNVSIGAHPSFDDRVNFGRMEMNLPVAEISLLIEKQLQTLQQICERAGTTLHHVKPHGALYNMSARDATIAQAVAEAVHACNPSLILFGLSGSHSIAEGVMAELKTAAEVFADRTYQPDGSLTPRSLPNALIQSDDEALQQALMLVEEQKVLATDGNYIPLLAETICLHGDGPHAVSFARNIHQTFLNRGIRIQPV
jgi:5-oxoprolinase (ATP-hydrolysing) subunit A